LNLGPLTW